MNARRKAAPRPCPCLSGRPYEECCAPHHRGEREAAEPTELMRARYSAFALGDAEFLWRTLHEEHEDRARPRDEVLRSLRGARDRLRYERLVILDARRRGREAEVLFCAGLSERGRDASFVELSDFEHDGEGWRYRSGIALPLAELGRPIDGLRIDELLALVAGR